VECTNVLPGAVAEDFDRELHPPVVVFLQLGLQHPHVVGQPGNTQQTRLCIQKRIDL